MKEEGRHHGGKQRDRAGFRRARLHRGIWRLQVAVRLQRGRLDLAGGALATGDYAIGLMLLSDVALAGLVYTAWRLGAGAAEAARG